MPAHTQLNAKLTFTYNGTDYSAQIITSSITLPSQEAAETIKVATGEDVAIATTGKRAGQIRGEVLTDTTTSGVTRALANSLDGQPRAYVFTINEGDAESEMSITGEATVEAFEIGFEPGGTGRHPISFAVNTAAIA
jgi:hypothetical protein